MFSKSFAFRRVVQAALSCLGAAALTASAATVTFSTTPPAVGPHDITNTVGATVFRGNVESGDANATYIANDRPIQGQTFITGNNANGYQLTAVTLRHVIYATYTLIPDIDYTLRVVRPTGTTLTVLASETAFADDAAPGNFPSNDGANGTGRFITFRFNTPIPLNANTTYGFDVGGGTVRHYWETDGFFSRTSDRYPAGTAYSSGAGGVGNNVFTERQGDRVFVVALSLAGTPVVTPPTISPSNAVYAGTAVKLNVQASGNPPLHYQWRVNDGSGPVPITGANNTNLMVDTTALLGEYNYDVVVTNSSATVTSAPVALTVFGASQPIITMNTTPSSATRYVGQSVTFTAAFDGTHPITYQWQRGDFGEDIPGATNATLTLSNLQLSDDGPYNVRAENSHGITVSAEALLTMLDAPPPPEPGTYPYAVLTNRVFAYWRLNDSPGSSLIRDSAGSYNAANNGVTLGVPGMQSPQYPGFPSDNTAGQFNGSSSVASTGESLMNGLPRFTILAWIKPMGPNGGITGLLGQNDALEGIFSDADGLTVWIQLNSQWYSPKTGPAGFTLNQWYLMTVVADGTNAIIYVNAVERARVSGGAPTASSSFPFNIGGPVIIGYPGENAFNGLIEDVAILEDALSQRQIEDLFSVASAAGPPSILLQPKSQTLYEGRTAQFTAGGIGGTRPLSYQWKKEGFTLSDGGRISGSHSNVLTISNVAPADLGNYWLTVFNAAGFATSDVATLTIVQPTGARYESAVLALNPRAYWRLNEAADPSPGTTPAHDYFGGFAGTYGTAALNGFNGIPGPAPSSGHSGFEAGNTALQTTANTDQAWITVPPLGLNSDAATFTMWIKPTGSQAEYTGLLMTRSGTEAGIGYGGTYQVNNAGQLIYTWNNNTTWTFQSALLIPQDQWSFVAVAIDPTKAVLHLFYRDQSNNNVLLSATNPVGHISEAWNGPGRIGGDPGGGDVSRTFNGIIDEVAVFNYALTPPQVLNLYNSGNTPPPVTLTIQRSGPDLVLSWSSGTLQENTSLTGTWSAVTGAAPPSHTVTPSGTQKFYRVLVSN
jgi:hypothetical protein